MSGNQEVSSTRLYLGNLPRNASKADVEAHFNTHGAGKITEIKLMNGFGFIEYEDAMDARDVVPAFHGTDFMGERLIVQFARGEKNRGPGFAHQERAPPRPRRTPFRMEISNIPVDTSWQDLKDFARQSGLDVVYSEVRREGDGKGFVEYETADDLRNAVEKLDSREFKNQNVRCVANVSDPPRMPPSTGRPPFSGQGPPGYPRNGARYNRSRSPGGRRPYPPPAEDYYDRRGPPRAYSPRRDDGYRRRSPPRGGYYDERDRYPRSPPRRPGPMDDYGPPRPRGYDDGYDARGPVPPRRGPPGYEDPYMNGHGRPGYDRPDSRRGRPLSPGPRRYDDYGRTGYW